ncbi:MAG TPA: cysteine--tRNA ligase [Acidimicrobiales bacterium]|jgi:cysteinyl-tRNA synthetase|nr:cysteine--tRNA ligase [Acidimicrobiales bacterium]
MLRLHDTATGTVRPFEPRTEGEVSMYVCGPTVYDVPHIGHGRANLTFDILRRYLSFTGLRVHHVANVTDVDDNIIKRASLLGRTEPDVAAEFEAQWWESMDALGDLRPNEIPHATQYIEHMVALVSDLVDREVAYETPDGVYLEVSKVAGYGLLAHQSLDSLQSGARVEANEDKRSPLDFALWKKAKEGEPSWASPWGSGRPGWHTECVVMSLDLLGEGFDLHGGGQDLMFPHHENERAQAIADGKTFARHWMHHGWVEVDGTKMSKSLGNFSTLPDLLARHDARAYRVLVLRAHYRSPIEVTPGTLADAEKALERLDTMARRFSVGGLLSRTESGYVIEGTEPATGIDPDALAAFRARMDDDLDTPGALAGIFDLVSAAHTRGDSGDEEGGRQLAHSAAVLAAALGLSLNGESGDMDEETARLVAERDAARSGKDFARADALRDELTALGWTVEDTPQGTAVRR